jgi:prepilin-type processing-associated H-X9-DG protein
MAGRAHFHHHTMNSLLPPPSCAGRISPRAFTLVDLLAVLAVLALCATMLAPALARTKSDSRVFQCLNNHAQLSRAWRLYAADNNEKLATNQHSHSLNYPIWAAGWLDWTASTDNTNTLFLTDARYSVLASYGGNDARLFKCPADTYASPVQQRLGGWSSRVRSMAQNLYVSTSNVETGPTDAAYVHVTKLTGLINPAPAATWMSLDEHPDSINDGGYFAPRIGSWIDLPANYHDGGAGFAFADGHSELHRWQASVLKVPITLYEYGGTATPLNDPDVAWLRYRTPRKAGAN